MIRSLIAGSAALSLVGCLHTPVPIEGAPGAPAYVPLQARIWPASMGGGGSISLRLSRPAYVAVFQIIPGAGTQLLYPRYGQPEQLSAGGHMPYIFGRGPGSAFRAASTTSRIMSRYGYGLGTPTWTQARHLFLVASESPLNLGQVQSSAESGFGLLSSFRFSSFSSNVVMDNLLSVVLPSSMDAEWVTDVYTYFPEPPPRQPLVRERVTTRRLWVTCNGSTIEIPPGVPLWRLNSFIVSGCTVSAHPPQAETEREIPIDTAGAAPGQMVVPRTRGSADTVGLPVRPPLGRTAPPRIAIGDQSDRPGVVERTRDAELRALTRAGDRPGGRTRSFDPGDSRRPVAEAQQVSRPLGRVAEPTERTREATPQARERQRAAPTRPRAEPARERPRAQPTRERPRAQPERPRAEPTRERPQVDRPRAEPTRRGEPQRTRPTTRKEPPRRAEPPRAEPTRQTMPTKRAEPPKRSEPPKRIEDPPDRAGKSGGAQR